MFFPWLAFATLASVPGDDLQSIDMIVGKGVEAAKGDLVTVDYTGNLLDGKVFDSSAKRSTFSFRIGAGDVIAGWDQGVPGMKVGGKRVLSIPPALGYKDQVAGEIPANSTLVFEIKLLRVDKQGAEPKIEIDEMAAGKGEPAKAGDKVMVVAFGQGVDVLVFEVTAENAKLPKRRGVSGWLARRKEEKNYMKFLAFNEMLPLDKGMRAEFDKKTALSVLWRKRDMIYGLVGGKCKVCGTVQFPRSQVCVNPNCHAMDSQEPYRMSGLEANVMSFTADSLTYSPDPPAYYGMITFPEGGRFMADFTDSDKEQVKVGIKMRMTFRIRDNDIMRGGFKRYFWKAAPA